MKGFLRYVGWAFVLGSSVPVMSVPALAQSGAAQPAAPSGAAQPAPSGLTPLPPISEPPGASPAPATPARAPAAAQPSAAGSARVAVGTAGTSGAVDTEVAPGPSDEASEELPTDPELDDTLRWRAQNTWLGPAGGVRVVDAASGPPGTARLQFGFDYFSADEYLFVLDHDEWLGGVLSLSVTPIEHLEVYGSLSTHANSNTAGDPVLLQVAGDVVLGVKGFTQILPWLGLGGDLRFLFLNTIGDLGVILKGTSVGFRGLATADLRRIQEPVPLVLRANIEYLLDNSGALIDGVEAARYEALDISRRRPIANEDAHLVNRIERFALGINRVDMFTISLGAEAPLRVDDDFFIQPLFEWRIGIPVNRQGYSCLSVPTAAGIDGDDSCLAIEGLSAAPSTLTLGARVLPPVRGLSGLLAFDIGLSGASTFVRELAPNRPWAVMFALGYAIDARPAKPQIQYVSAPVAPVAVEKTRVRGTVVERGFGTAIVGAIVRYPDTDLSPQLTNAYGQWISYQFDPGDIVIEITHPDYDPGRCTVKIPAPAKAALPSVAEALQPYAGDGTAPVPAQPGAAPPPAAPPAPPAFVEVRCELTAHPRSGALRGSVQDDKNAPVPGVSVEISGPSPQTVVSDASGSFTLSGLPVGEYVARVDLPAYLLKTQPFSVTSGGDASLPLVLTPKPKDAAVTLTAKEVKIRDQIMFKTGSAEIDERSSPLLSEIADVLLRNPQAAHVQVQGHTDNIGDPEANLTLSQQRAEAVVQSLVSAGVGSDRLEAKGYGDSRPLVPNLTPGNRARNRRVQFIVKE